MQIALVIIAQEKGTLLFMGLVLRMKVFLIVR